MHFSHSFLIAALPFLGLASASPAFSGAKRSGKVDISLTKRTRLVKPSGPVDISALKAHVAFSTAKIQRGLDAYAKNTGIAHPLALKSVVTKRDTGSVQLTDDNEELWYGSIAVGTPPLEFTVDFDTGSSDLFLPGASCGSSCGSHTVYDPSQSSTSQDVGQTFSLSYGDGSTTSGEQYTDTVSIAGLTSQGQTLGAASQYSSSFQSSPADGLMGMAFQSISEYNASPLFQSLVSAGATSSPVFAFKLADSGASLTIGGVDQSLYTGDFTYVPVTQQGYWQVAFDAVSVGNSQALGSIAAIIDSGTTLIVGDSQNVAKFYNSVPGAKSADDLGQGFYTFPCNEIPSTSITFGGKKFNIDPSTLSLGPASDGSSECVGGIVAQDTGSNFWIVGDVFMRNVYTVFDYGNSQVGFADLA